MSEKLLDILKPRGDCLPEELLIRYAEGKLSADEARTVEEHISECEFCSDALDGIMQGGNAQHFHSQLSSIKKIVHKRVRSSEPGATFPITRRLAVAATLLLLAISAWYVQYLVNNNAEQIFTHQFEPYPVPKTETDTIQIAPAVQESKAEAQQLQNATDKITSPSSVPKREEKKESEKTPAVPSLPQEVAAEQSSSITMNDNTDVASQEQHTLKKVQTDSIVAFSKSQDFSGAPSQVEGLSKTRSKQSQDDIVTYKASAPEATNDNFKNAMSLYQSNNYSEAIAEFEIVLQEEPNNPAANFYSGVSSLALKNPDEALKYFKNTDNKNSQYYEATLWYEALSYLNKGDKKQAKNLLEKVVKLNGEYRMKAEETLKQL